MNPINEANALYKFTVSYDGTLYSGFQRQGVAPTVQLALEDALRTIGWEEKSIVGAGRTDAGVHAVGQVFSARLRWMHGERALQNALNANLPDDIVIHQVSLKPEGFHPRFDAVSRTYRYQIRFSELRDPLQDRYHWRIWPPLDAEILNQTAALMIGTHDFCAFGSPPRKNGSTIRNVYQSEWLPRDEQHVTYQVKANAFLYHMVRRMVWFQIQVATGKFSFKLLKNALNCGEFTRSGLAPAHGLQLFAVEYAETEPTEN